MTCETEYTLIGVYRHKLGDAFVEVVTLEETDGAGAAVAMPVPTRASLHIRDSQGGTVLARLDSDATTGPDGSIALATTATGGIQVSLSLAGSEQSDWDADEAYYADLQFLFSAGANLPSPWTAGEMHILTYVDNTEVTA